MKKIIFIIALISSSMVLNKTWAQKQLPPEAGTPKDFHLAANKEVLLANGLKGVMVSYGNIPKVEISLIIKTGNIHEAENQVWLADLTGKMLREGSTRYNAKALSKKVAAMGG
ncbi:MAG TPA: insulinase family protein, partial [Flavisolibacter sp.]|nr:insulinase family protein [Flavisolibacter sp.]